MTDETLRTTRVEPGVDLAVANKGRQWTNLEPRQDVIDACIRYLLNTWSDGFTVETEYSTMNPTYHIKGYVKRVVAEPLQLGQELLDSEPFV